MARLELRELAGDEGVGDEGGDLVWVHTPRLGEGAYARPGGAVGVYMRGRGSVIFCVFHFQFWRRR